MSAVAGIETVPFRLPLKGRLAWGRDSVLESAEGVLVRVLTRDGAVGVAEAPPRPTIYGETRHSIVAVIREQLAPRLVGRPVEDLEGARAAIAFLANNHTAKGAVDMALWDAHAEERGVSLAERLAVPAGRKVEVSYILGLAEPRAALAEAQWVYEQGVRVLKVKIGGDLEADLQKIELLRDELEGRGVRLYVDANETLSATEWPQALGRLRDAGVLWVEEPLPVELLRERARLRHRSILPLIADDSAFSLRDLRRELELDTFDILNIKPARTGYGESLRMLELARERGKGVMVGSQASTTLGTARAALVAGLPGVEYPSELSFFLRLEDEIVDRVLEIRDGRLDLDQVAAIRIDESRLRKFSLD